MRRAFNRLIMFSALAIIGFAVWVYRYAHDVTAMPASVFPYEFSIEKGDSLRMAGERLYQAGIVRHPWAFVLIGRLQGRAGEIKAGNYVLERAATPLALLNKITQGDIILGKLAFIEGWRFQDIRRSVAAHTGLRHDTLTLSDAELLQAIGVEETHLEGLLFPDTYFFDQGSSELALYQRAYHAMQQHLAAEWEKRAAGLPYRTPYEALIMASIIEKETGAAEERRLIASVFLNRLRLGMRLQTDPTVIYGLGERFDGNLRRVDLLSDTPYNTYTRAGLPPTPIASPGLASIQAALNPETSKALYFVAKGNGRHVFSETLDAHNRAVNRYQRGR